MWCLWEHIKTSSSERTPRVTALLMARELRDKAIGANVPPRVYPWACLSPVTATLPSLSSDSFPFLASLGSRHDRFLCKVSHNPGWVRHRKSWALWKIHDLHGRCHHCWLLWSGKDNCQDRVLSVSIHSLTVVPLKNEQQLTLSLFQWI